MLFRSQHICDRIAEVEGIVDQDRGIRCLEQAACSAVTPIHILRVETVDVMHYLRDIGARRVQDLMKVIAHEYMGETLSTTFLESAPDNLKESSSLPVIDENGLLPVAPRHHVIDRPAESDPMPSTHAGSDPNGGPYAIGAKSAEFGLRRQD